MNSSRDQTEQPNEPSSKAQHPRPRAWWGLVLVPVAIGGAIYGTTAASASPTSSVKATKASTKVLVTREKTAKYGVILVTSKGDTLYRYTVDSKDKSSCTGACAAAWPPLTAANSKVKLSAGIAGLGTFHRQGGALQLEYNGLPLYTFTGDTKADQTIGQGVGGTWFVVKIGEKAKSPSAPSPTTTTTTVAGGYPY